MKLWVEKGLNFGPTIGFCTVTVLQPSRHTLCQAVSGPKIDYRNAYSTDLAPNDFWLLPKIKSALKGRRFQDVVDIQKNVTTLKAVPQQELQKCFQQ
jgi:hypothetical protein